jgi:hypothetical protein
MHKEAEQTFLKRRDMNGQKIYEKKVHVSNHQRHAN